MSYRRTRAILIKELHHIVRDSRSLTMALSSFPPSQEAGGYPGHNCERRYVSGHDCPRPNQAASAHGHSGQDDRVRADVRPRLDSHWPDLEIRLDHGNVDRYAGVRRTQHFCARPPTHVLLDHEVPRVQVALGTDPHVITDDAPPVEPPLEVGLRADEHPVSYLERLRVLEPDPATNVDTVAKPGRERPPDRPPHQEVDVTVAEREPCVQFDQRLSRILPSKLCAQADLEGGIGLDFAPTVHGPDDADAMLSLEHGAPR